MLSVSFGAAEAEPAIRSVVDGTRTASMGLEVVIDVEVEAGTQLAAESVALDVPTPFDDPELLPSEPATLASPAEDAEVQGRAETEASADASDDVLQVIFASQEDGDDLWRDLLGLDEQ